MATTALPTFECDELVQSHPVATILTDSAGTILFVNAAAEQLCNLGRSAIIGRAVYDVIRMDSSVCERMSDPGFTGLFAHHSEISVGGRRPFFADLQMAASGSDGHRILALIPAPSESDLMGGSIGRSAKAAGAAASMLAHEIKNPLAGIKGAAQLIARNTGESSDRFTDLICTEVDRIAMLIDQMEHFSRGQPIICTAINPYLAIHQALDATRAKNLCHIRLVEEFDPSIPAILGNHDAMVQILLNLLTNASEAVAKQEGAAIRVSTAFRHGLSLDAGDGRGRLALPIEIAVSDNGPGIADVIRDALFEPFVTTKREGRGLGLALVAKLARDMGGAVQCSRNDDWTHFRLHLPAAPKAEKLGNVA